MSAKKNPRVATKGVGSSLLLEPLTDLFNIGFQHRRRCSCVSWKPGQTRTARERASVYAPHLCVARFFFWCFSCRTPLTALSTNRCAIDVSLSIYIALSISTPSWRKRKGSYITLGTITLASLEYHVRSHDQNDMSGKKSGSGPHKK